MLTKNWGLSSKDNYKYKFWDAVFPGMVFAIEPIQGCTDYFTILHNLIMK